MKSFLIVDSKTGTARVTETVITQQFIRRDALEKAISDAEANLAVMKALRAAFDHPNADSVAVQIEGTPQPK